MRLKRVDAISEFLANWFTAESSHLSNWQELVLSLLREFVDKRRSDAENLVRGRFMACSVKWDAIRYIGKNVYMISITCHQHDICIRKCIYIYLIIFAYWCLEKIWMTTWKFSCVPQGPWDDPFSNVFQSTSSSNSSLADVISWNSWNSWG